MSQLHCPCCTSTALDYTSTTDTYWCQSCNATFGVLIIEEGEPKEIRTEHSDEELEVILNQDWRTDEEKADDAHFEQIMKENEEFEATHCPDCGIEKPRDSVYCSNQDCPNFEGYAPTEH